MAGMTTLPRRSTRRSPSVTLNPSMTGSRLGGVSQSETTNELLQLQCSKARELEQAQETPSKCVSEVSEVSVEKGPVDLIGQIRTLAGETALSTFSETRIPFGSSYCRQLVECLAQFCKSAHSAFIQSKKIEQKIGVDLAGSNESFFDAKKRIKETLIGDLNGARIFVIELTKVKPHFQDEKEFELVSLESVMLLTEIMLQDKYEDAWVSKTSCDVLALMFESGLVSSMITQNFLDDVKLAQIWKWVKDGTVSRRMFSNGVSSLLTVIGSICQSNGTVLCSNSKDSCFIPFLWTLIDYLISGDTTTHDKDEVSNKQPLAFRYFSEERYSLNVAFAEAFCKWLGPQFSQK